MAPGILTKYNASAGSGKTFRLTGEYLDYLFVNPSVYRNILAVTFTNKAAAEMKERILSSLYRISSGQDPGYLDHLREITGKSSDQLEKEALSILESILHDYSMFSVGTIDSFFQKILRSFARESGLQAGFNLVLDPSVVLSQAVDEMLNEAENDPLLLRWLTEYAYMEVQAGKNWNLKRKIVDLGGEIFKENYRLLNEGGYIVSDKLIINDAATRLTREEAGIRARLKSLAGRGLELLDRYDVTDDQLYGKGNGLRKIFRNSLDAVPDSPGKAIIVAYNENRYTSLKATPPPLESALEAGLDNIVREYMTFYESIITRYRSAKLVLDNLYTLGLLNDISAKVRELLGESNRFLLSDAGDVLRQIIGRDQAPFIYEKAGNRYANFMIDEFQDTSMIQWDNFLPLIRNSLSEGESNLVVGDIKQAIYRWRNSNWRIFNELDSEFHPEQFSTRVLAQNWRSRANIIRFNNFIFSGIPSVLEDSLNLSPGSVTGIYGEAVQEDPGIYNGGYVRIEGVEATDEQHQDEIVMQKLPLLIEEIQDHGYLPGDIGILVRTNDEGQRVIDSILRYADMAEPSKRERYSYEVISQDSLMLGHNPSIKFILATLRYITNEDDNLARASMVHHFLQVSAQVPVDERPVLIPGDRGRELFDSLPAGTAEFLQNIRFLPLFEIVDRITGFFALTVNESEIPFITTLQDLILELSGTEANDIPLFLEWWENEGYRKSVASPEQPGAIQLMTIHKSKGLEFRVVILPFLSWTFNHARNPVIWVMSGEETFSSLGAIPVGYKQEISGTYFAQYYEEEKTQVAIDRLNLMYVAFTRARECLFGFAPEARIKLNCGRILMDSLKSGINDGRQGDDTGVWDDSGNIFSLGEFTVCNDSNERAIEPGIDIPYNVEINDNRLRLRLSSRDYIGAEAPGDTSRINYGLIMHELFSSVSSAGDINPGLEKLCSTGRISVDQKELLERKIDEALNNDLVSSWFDPGNETRSESVILTRGGETRRPDRVIINDIGATIVDFKFGEESYSHRKQLKEYSSLLSEMGYKNVKAYLWYVEQGRVEEVLV